MNGLLSLLAFNAAAMTLLALGVRCLKPWLRGPRLARALWIVVLLRALAPPLLLLPILPPLGHSQERSAASETALAVEPAEVAAARPVGSALPLTTAGSAAGDSTPPLEPSVPPLVTPSRAAAAALLVWALGALTVSGLAISRGRRFERSLKRGDPAPRDLQEMGRRAASGLGTRCPPIRVVPARISPLLWYRPGCMLLALPEHLLAKLTAVETELLLVHELAHLRRRDHWVRLAETAVSIVFWWHPLLGWIRGRLRDAEERCCDESVARYGAATTRTYAKALLKCAAFLTGTERPRPALCSGLGLASLEERIQAMLSGYQWNRKLTFAQKTVWTALAALVLVCFPIATAAQSGKAASHDYDRALRGLNREMLELDRRQQEIEAQRLGLQIKRLEVERERELAQLRREVESLKTSSEHQQAAFRARETELVARKLDLELQALRLHSEAMVRRAELTSARRSLGIDMEEAAARDDSDRHSRLKSEAAEVHELMNDFERRTAKALRENKMAALQVEQELGRVEVERLRSIGRDDEASRLEESLLAMRDSQGFETIRASIQKYIYNGMVVLGPKDRIP